MRPLVLLIIVMNVGFILFGVAAVLWTVNEWSLGNGLNAIFGGFMALLVFSLGWRFARRWAKRRVALLRGNG